MIKGKNEELFYRIALTQAGLVGDKTGRQLLQHFESASAIFHASRKQLLAIEGFGQKKAELLRNKIDEAKINREIAFIKKHNIAPLFISDNGYPKILRTCADAPLMLYYKGDADMNSKKMVAVIGTRKNTDYGSRITEELVEELQALDVIVVSGLAFGIDII